MSNTKTKGRRSCVDERTVNYLCRATERSSHFRTPFSRQSHNMKPSRSPKLYETLCQTAPFSQYLRENLDSMISVRDGRMSTMYGVIENTKPKNFPHKLTDYALFSFSDIWSLLKRARLPSTRSESCIKRKQMVKNFHELVIDDFHGGTGKQCRPAWSRGTSEICRHSHVVPKTA